ncbi:hypothetical protein JG687_00005435 [Phytophthora cactorum]|uniref:RXLR phytopathogen effector protein WY-domain domain-containing protein n=1 Tax=Phytophthora cactorum TaxID=29920 RepID=A0A8T1UN71_9STRA|nr:hypothetical protein JG687_00005435 [Phytophthora cactorum]
MDNVHGYYQTTSASILSPGTFLHCNQEVGHLKKEIRSYDAPKQDNIGVEDKIKEERAGVPGMTKLDELAYKMALKTTIDPMGIFKRLRVVKTGGKLDGNKEFILWLLYVNQYRTKRGGRFWFSDDKLFDLLRKTKSEEELVTLFQSLRQYQDIKYITDDMQAYMILSSASSHRLVNEAWLKSRETPEKVFNILRLGAEALFSLDSSPLFIQWLRYIIMYRAVVGSDSFTDLQTLDFLLERSRLSTTTSFGTLIQSFKDIPDLEIYRNLKAYTMYFAEHRGGADLLDKVNTMFDNNDPYAAITAASKA